MTLANQVTLLRIAFIPLIIGLLLLGLNGLAAIFFLLLSFSDALDGYLARRLQQVSDLGKFLDPLADKILVITVLIALVGLGKADSVPVIIIAARELIVQGLRIHSAARKEIIAAAPIAKWKTTAQIIAVAMLILSLPFADWVLWAAAVLSLASATGYLKHLNF